MRNQDFPLLALLVLSLGFFSICCHARNLEQSCPPSSCGDLHNISDPFRLKDDPVGCGSQNFELSCVANQTILLIQNMPFYVKEINYTSRYLRIIDVRLADDKCLFSPNHLTTPQLQQDNRFRFPPMYNTDFFTATIDFITCLQVVSDPKYLFVPCASTPKENAYVTPDLRVSDLKSSCRHVASVPVSLPFNRYQNLSSLAGVQRLLANGFNYMWSESCHIYDVPSDCAFQCSKNATRDYFVSMFRENQDSIDEKLCVSLDSCKNNSSRLDDYFSSCIDSSCEEAVSFSLFNFILAIMLSAAEVLPCMLS
ncbi:hypothetical protein QJS04_geneDACA002917 [Acorus gramineus]|uniref:Wall-associated receptor kinase galacturonan-binding domain-containing protein n=1 Tax=Acorus gramineus TaxID=55184 RepID=A0AAV9BYI9_ACOGR|nr:hypothetical protein QJS04_geneDACA002917 [Acorus gramineus]